MKPSGAISALVSLEGGYTICYQHRDNPEPKCRFHFPRFRTIGRINGKSVAFYAHTRDSSAQPARNGQDATDYRSIQRPETFSHAHMKLIPFAVRFDAIRRIELQCQPYSPLGKVSLVNPDRSLRKMSSNNSSYRKIPKSRFCFSTKCTTI